MGEGALEVVEEALVVLGPGAAVEETEVFRGHVVQVGGVLAVVGHEGLAEHGDAEEGLHGLDGGREGDLVDLCEAVGCELVLAFGDLVPEELGGAVADNGLGILEEDVVFLTPVSTTVSY